MGLAVISLIIIVIVLLIVIPILIRVFGEAVKRNPNRPSGEGGENSIDKDTSENSAPKDIDGSEHQEDE